MNAQEILFDVSKDVKKQIVEKTFDWCIKNYGTNEKIPIPKLLITNRVSQIAKKHYHCGEYRDNKNLLLVHPNHNYQIKTLVNTIIHEYTHYKQDMSLYNKLYEEFGYTKHPQEVEARTIANRDTMKCWKEIKKLINYEK